jgi:hypothetical protein
MFLRQGFKPIDVDVYKLNDTDLGGELEKLGLRLLSLRTCYRRFKNSSKRTYTRPVLRMIQYCKHMTKW